MEDYQQRMIITLRTVEHRQREIGALLDTVIVKANRAGRSAAFSKVITIVIGAFIATSGAAQILFGGETVVVLVSYTLLGVAIAAVVALSTAFRFDDRASGLNRLSVDCRAAMLDLHYRYQRTVQRAAAQQRADAALDMVVEWDTQLMQLRQRAAELGLIIKTEFQPVSSEEEIGAVEAGQTPATN
ncbi:MAG: hypothetical protein IIB29_01860 [Chloroflexi bacterium]|nr:hypothetical protein [Chloroflexota bacterium]